MAVLVTDPWVEERLRAERVASGADHYDEIWEGVYFMPPMPNDEHQQVTTLFGGVFLAVVHWPGLGDVRVGVNVSDRVDGWMHNYRVPDVAVFLRGTSARNCDTHWCGGPDFLVEIVSPDDRSREKLPFYAQVGVRELLLVDRYPWALELYQLRGQELVLAGRISLERPGVLISGVLPLTFRLIPGGGRPQIEITHRDGVQRWVV